MCACAATRVAEGGVGVGLAKPLVKTQGLGQGPSGEMGAIHICAQNGCSGSNGVGGLVCGR